MSWFRNRVCHRSEGDHVYSQCRFSGWGLGLGIVAYINDKDPFVARSFWLQEGGPGAAGVNAGGGWQVYFSRQWTRWRVYAAVLLCVAHEVYGSHFGSLS